MRVGLFGGTFNPVHIAHLRCAEEAREALGLDRVLFIPSATPPHKRSGVAAAPHRLAMVRLALRGNPAFRVSKVEIERDGPSFLVDTLRILRRRAPADHLVFLLGVDAMREIDTWREWRSIFSLADLAVFTRPPHAVSHLRAILPVAARGEFCYQKDQANAVHSSGNRITLLKQTALDISSSDIRQRLSRGQSIRYLVPAPVERYVREHRLYL